jgi:hypothetical protein
MKVPLLVIELRTLFIRSRVLETARGREAPSRIPQAPPIARPVAKQDEHVMEEKTIRNLKLDVRRDKVSLVQGEKEAITYYIARKE